MYRERARERERERDKTHPPKMTYTQWPRNG